MPVATLRRLAALALLASAGAAPALEGVPALDLDTARRMAGACEALALQSGPHTITTSKLLPAE